MQGSLTAAGTPLTATLVAESFVSLSGRLTGIELLTRFCSATGQALPPADVIRSMTREEKRQLLGRQLTAVAKQATFITGRRLICTLNADRDMVGLLCDDPELGVRLVQMPFLQVEIHEDAGHPSCAVWLRQLRRLSEMAPLVMDDYGTGLADDSALAYGLYRTVKIDRGVFRHHAAQMTLAHLVSRLRHRCSLVIAEGVETRAHRDAALLAGVDAMQGRLFPCVPVSRLQGPEMPLYYGDTL